MTKFANAASASGSASFYRNNAGGIFFCPRLFHFDFLAWSTTRIVPDYSAEIAELEAIVNGATESVSVDGTSTKWSLAEARRRLAELRTLDSDSIAAGRARPRVTSLKLGSA